MNTYEIKQARRKERYEELAQKLENESNLTYEQAMSMSDAIPAGQPILVGHYSEKSDRRYRDRMNNKMRKSIDIQKKADYYREKAACVGNGGISSDDPEAIEKLKEKLVTKEKYQNQMKRANAFIRRGDHEGLKQLGLNDFGIENLFKPDFAGRIGFPDYELRNNNAEIRRLKQRIIELETRRNRKEVVEHKESYIYREDVAENRVMFEFEGKPDEATRNLLKSHGFRWSPTRVAWVRHLNSAGKYAAEDVKFKLKKST